MASLLTRYRNAGGGSVERDGFLEHFLFNGTPHYYGLHDTGVTMSMDGVPQESAPDTFTATVRLMHRRNGVISAAVTARALLISQLRFRWRSETSGEMFGTGALGLLERPSPAMTREQLLWRIEQDISYSGNAYIRRVGNQLFRLRPDWVQIVLGSDESPDDVAAGADVHPLAYLYRPDRTQPAQAFGLGEVAHLAPEPDPIAHYRGEAWVTGVIRETLIDSQATDHLGTYFENATTANMVISAPPTLTDPTKFSEWVDAMDRTLTDTTQQWRNVYLGGGADAKVVGANLAELDLKNLQGGGESRVSARSRVPAAILGIREGMAGSALNAGNYTATRRLWADGWFSPYAQAVCSSLERITARPAGSELTFDPSRVLFLQEDQADAAAIFNQKAAGMRQLIDGGFRPETVVEAADRGDITLLEHSGNLSVQLHPDGQVANTPEGTNDE